MCSSASAVLSTRAHRPEAYSQPFMVTDALADFTEEEHRMACEYASGRCARVLDTAEALEQITAGAPGADGAPETGKARA